MLRWLRRAPEDFLTGPVFDVGDVGLPEAGPDSRLRWDLKQTHEALNEQRRERDITWAQLARELDCTPSRLTNMRTARLADMDLTMRITQCLGRPAAAFIHPASMVIVAHSIFQVGRSPTITGFPDPELFPAFGPPIAR
jgi:hypothetical protein